MNGVCPIERYLDSPFPIDCVHGSHNRTLLVYIFRVRLCQDTFWAERCGYEDRLGGSVPRLGGRALRPHDLLFPCVTE